jgi:hypothetical protein
MRSPAEFEAVQTMLARGMNDFEIARVTGIPLSTVRRWKVDPGIESRRNRQSTCPICHDGRVPEADYAYLLGLYLGDGHIAKCGRDVFRLDISLDSKYPGIVSECQCAVVKVRQYGVASIRNYASWSTVYSCWKHWPCILPHGVGPKHRRKIELANWQQDIASQHSGKLLRGLIHSDGCRGTNTVRNRLGTVYSYPRYQFTSYSDDIRGIFCKACENYGVGWTQMNWRTISVARKQDVERLDKVIGPKR